MREVYRRAWKELKKLREFSEHIDRECTPILVFGKWRTARIVTAGLNPSTYEFRDPEAPKTAGARPALDGQAQRFLHWGNGRLNPVRLDEAFRRAEGYFSLGNSNDKWFSKYDEFLASLNAPFAKGKSCHTDYISPFTTRVRISRCKPAAALLEEAGFQYWLDVLELCPKLELIFGHGRGWNRVQERLGITLVDKPTPFDGKGTQGRHLSFARAVLPKNKRSVLVYWWHQNFSGMPLCSLKPEERAHLGKMIRKHVTRIAPESDIARWAALPRH